MHCRMTKEEANEDGGASGDGPKPMNVFYVWYTELCRRAGSQPVNYVKPAKPKNENVLDFVCDRLKPEEWSPVLNALRLDTSLHVIAIRSRNRCKFLHDIDTEDKIKQMKRRAGSLYTAFISRALLKSLCNCIKKSTVLSSLELDGVPIGVEDVEVLVDALKRNKVIKMLTLRYCQIRDLGCQILCNALRQMPNIEVLNLTGCGLGPMSAQYIAKVVKVQQINRYCESWHNSLRYEDPDVGIMAGLKRITLNNNANMGNEGLTYILDELDDDLWIKALDMQRCGVTQNIAQRLLDVIEYSRSMEIADFRNNDLSQTTIDHIFELLKQKRNFGSSECEFKWCFTTSTLRGGSTSAPDTQSKCSIFYPPGKSKSVPIKNAVSPTPLRRTKTSSMICKKASEQTVEKCGRNVVVVAPIVDKQAIDFKRSYTCLNHELKKETNKRIQSELENKKLKAELERIKSMSTISDLSIAKERTVKFNAAPKKAKKKSKSAKPAGRSHKMDENVEANNHFKPATNVEFVFENKNIAYNVFQKLVANSHRSQSESTSDGDLVNYFKDIVKDDVDDGSSDSQLSLINFMREIKNASSTKSAENKYIWNAPANKGFLQKVH